MGTSAAWLTGALAVANAGAQALGLTVPVSYEAWIGPDGGFGKQKYADAVSLQAMVRMDPAITRTGAGQAPNLLAVLSFLEPVPPNGAAGRHEPIDMRDRFTLPGGKTGPIVDIKDGVIAGSGEMPVTHQVKLGKGKG